MAKHDYAAIARQYAKDVVAGKILACKWVQRACERQLADLNRFKGKDSPYRGLAKNTVQLITLFALSNIWMVRGRLMQRALG